MRRALCALVALLFALPTLADEADVPEHVGAGPDVEAAEPVSPSPVPDRSTGDAALRDVPASGAEFLRRGLVGIASFYAHEFAGRKTASGEVFDPELLTAAHRFLPLGTEIRVTNLDNGRSATAIVNDRGPYARGRVLDASLGLARKLGFVRAGTARVRIDILGWQPIAARQTVLRTAETEAN